MRALAVEAGSEFEFDRLRQIVNSVCGIKMPPSKNPMLWSRLQRRIRRVNLSSVSEYCDYIQTPEGAGNEFQCMVDAVTTHKTDFFREPAHFSILAATILPELSKLGAGTRRKLEVWSAGCSTGEEPYSLAMALEGYSEARPAFRYGILATDISVQSLHIARLGIYPAQKAEAVPGQMKGKYFMVNKANRDILRVAPDLRQKVAFRRLNFMDEAYGIKDAMDVVFFRNVLIYFERRIQEALVRKVAECIRPGGVLFVGHSETLHGLDVPLSFVVPTVYRKSG